jgi:hypothetical protein
LHPYARSSRIVIVASLISISLSALSLASLVGLL